MGLMTNFLSLKEMFLISLHGKPIFGVNLRSKKKRWEKLHVYLDWLKKGLQTHFFFSSITKSIKRVQESQHVISIIAKTAAICAGQADRWGSVSIELCEAWIIFHLTHFPQ